MKARLGVFAAAMSMVLMAMGMPGAHAVPVVGVGVVTGSVKVNASAGPGAGHVPSATSDPILTTYTFLQTAIAGAIVSSCGVAVGVIKALATGASLEENALSASGTVNVTSIGPDPAVPHVGTIGFGGLVGDPADFTGHFIRLGPVVIVHLTFSDANFGGATDCEFQVVIAAVFVPTGFLPANNPAGLVKLAAFAGLFLSFAGNGLS